MELSDFRNVEFGLAFIIDNEQVVFRIPVDLTVKSSLVEMRDEFFRQYGFEENPEQFSPSEKYGSSEVLIADLNSEYLHSIRELFYLEQIPISSQNLSQIQNSISFYFAIFTSQDGSKEMGVKRPAQFKGLLSKKNRLMRMVDDTLEIIPDDIFKLDNDFDFIVDSNDRVMILHPTGFIFISDMEEVILRTISSALAQVSTRIPCINFGNIEAFIIGSKRAAKLLASIKSRPDLEFTSLEKLISRCQSLRLTVIEENGQIYPHESHVLDFLYVLDRRQYDIDITELDPEVYLAASRRQVR